MSSLARDFKEQLTAHPHAVLGVVDSKAEIIEVLSGPNMWVRAFELKKELAHRGAKAGDIIQVKAEGVDFVISFLACLIGHFILEPVSAGSSSEDILAIIFTSPQEKLHFKKKNIRLILKTSGTEGSPKILFFSEEHIHQQLKEHINKKMSSFEETRLCLLPWTHSFGFVLDLCLGLFSRNILIIPEKQKLKNNPQWIRNVLNKYFVDILACVPRQLELIAFDNDLNSTKAPKLIHVGGAKTPNLLAARISNWQKSNQGYLLEGYGLTEAGPGVLIDHSPVGCEVRIQNNELEVRAPFWSYDQISLTLSEESNPSKQWIKTGDLAELKNGKIVILGRKKFALKNQSGQFVGLESLEAFLEDYFQAHKVIIVNETDSLMIKLIVSLGHIVKESDLEFTKQFFEKKFAREIQFTIDVLDYVTFEKIKKSKKKSLDLTWVRT